MSVKLRQSATYSVINKHHRSSKSVDIRLKSGVQKSTCTPPLANLYPTMPLSDAKARNAKLRPKSYKMLDGEGLFLLITPAGGRYWRLRYYFGDKEKLLALGVYPEITLADARERRANAKKLLAKGVDPGEAKKEAKRLQVLEKDDTFEMVGREWYGKREHEWASSTAADMLARMESHLFPKLGHRPISQITATELLAVLRLVEANGTLEMTRRVRQICGQVYMYAIATGRAERNPVLDLRGALKTPVAKHHAFLRTNDLPEYLKKLSIYDGHLQTKLALSFLLLVFVRTGELRGALKTEIEWDKAEWRIPPERMKMKEAHIVPLSRQAITVLRELEPYSASSRYLFPNQNNPDRPMSENTMLYALYRMGYHSRATGHGFRSTASTILNEHGFRPDVIERQLAHNERNSVRAAYNHAQYLPERRDMMQWWADYLDKVVIEK
ncbi:MAG TPA: integrase arm-type DNA-binding domain-containing protein [Pirellulales bacterium]|jgi:integrase